MDKSREPLISFRWRKDADGYALAGEKIVRRGGRMIEYDPASVRPALHRVFATIYSQTRAHAEMEGCKLSDDPAAPFHMRGFDNAPSAMLAFVNEYGFLGSDRTGADAEREDVIYLTKQSDSLRHVMHWARIIDGPSSRNAAEIAGAVVDVFSPDRSKSEQRFKPNTLRDAMAYLGMDEALTGPSLRMVFAPTGPRGRMQVHYEPESLYAWMWLQTAGDLTTGVDWTGAPCFFCMEPMGRGPGAHRRDAKFCSDKHRTYFDRLSPAEQRKRRKRATEIARGQGAAGVDGGE
jgi:hypothetical protein